MLDYVSISLDMSEYDLICVNVPKSAWMAFALRVSIITRYLLESVLTYFNGLQPLPIFAKKSTSNDWKKDFVIKTHGKPIASNFNTNICKQLYVLIWFSFLTSNCPDKFPWNLVKHLRYLTTFWVRICIYRIPPTYPSKSFRDVTCMLLNIKGTIFSDGLIHMSTASLFV